MKTVNYLRNTNLKSLYFGLILFWVCIQNCLAQDPLLLPLGLESFNANVGRLHTILSWNWLAPDKAKDFVVERAGADGIFHSIGTTISNQFVDHNPKESIHYYRLLSYDDTGRELYSPIVVAELKLTNELLVAPNPALDFVDINFYTEGEDKQAKVILLNQQGNLIYQETIDTSAGGMQHVHLDMEKYDAGMYILRVVEGANAKTVKVVVL